MKITKVEIRKLALPMIHSFTVSFGKISHKDTVITKLFTSDGLVGYGESSSFFAPLYNHETVDTCMYVQEKFIAPRLIGKTFTDPVSFRAAYDGIIGNRTAKTGPECAFWHLLAQRDDKSLKELLGGTRSEIMVGESIGIKSVPETLQEIDQRIREGYARIKVKIQPGWDVELLRAIRHEWPHISLMADANSSYREEHMELLQSLDSFHLTMIEQPFAPDALVAHAQLQKTIATPICFDESIETLEDLHTAVALKACRVVNIKPGRVGGLVESCKIHDIAKDHDMGVWCGGLLETGIGRAFNIALASKDNFTYAGDISPFHVFFAEDLIEQSFVVKPNGCIDVPETPGLGYAINDAQIEKFTIEKKIVC